jgi:hypothetical protein
MASRVPGGRGVFRAVAAPIVPVPERRGRGGGAPVPGVGGSRAADVRSRPEIPEEPKEPKERAVPDDPHPDPYRPSRSRRRLGWLVGGLFVAVAIFLLEEYRADRRQPPPAPSVPAPSVTAPTVEQLIRDLHAHPELIPAADPPAATRAPAFEPGGTTVHPDGLVEAAFVTGETRDRLRLRYTVDADGGIHWRVVDPPPR